MNTKEKIFSAHSEGTQNLTDASEGQNTQEAFSGVSFQEQAFGKHNARGAQTAHNAYAAHDCKTQNTHAPQGESLGGLFTPEMFDKAEENVLDIDQLETTQYNALADISDDELLSICQPRLCVKCPVAQQANDQRLRSLAEVDNARKRMNREKEEQARYAGEAILADIVPALDNLDLALKHAPSDATCKNFAIGVDMTSKLLIEALKKHGLEKVGSVGEAFDPAIHEAVATDDVADTPDGHIASLLSCGYKLRERLLRPARVVVCKKT